MSSGAPSFKPKLHRQSTFAGGGDSAVSSSTSEATGFDSERPAVASGGPSGNDAALECARLELQVSNAALAVVVRALRRSQQINSELRVLQSQKSVPVSGNSTSDLVAAVADELTNMPPGPAAASLLPVIMEQAIKETDAFNRAFYDASMSAPLRPDSPDISQFSMQSSQHSAESPRSENSLSSPVAFATALGDRDAAPSEAAPLPPMQQYMWDSVLWPIVSSKIDSIMVASFILEDLLHCAVQTCTARPYPSSSCVTVPIWIDAVEHPALSSFIIAHVIQPLQTLVAVAGLDIRVVGPLGSAWGRTAAGCASADDDSCDAFWSSCLRWGRLPVSYLVAAAAEPASVCISVIGQRLIQPLPFNACSLGLIRRHNITSAPTSYHEACILNVPPHMPIDVPRISCVISPQDNADIGLLQRQLLGADFLRVDPKYTDQAQLAAAAAVASSDWSLQQSPLQWLAAFQLKRRILQADVSGKGQNVIRDADHTVMTLIGQGNVVASLQRQLMQQLFVWFPILRQAAESLAATCKGGIKSSILRQMYQQPFLLLSDPFAFHRSISQLQVEYVPSRTPAPRQTHWASRKEFTGSSAAQCCDQSWFKSGRVDIAKGPLLRPHPPSLVGAGTSSVVQGSSWQLQTTQLLLHSLALCFGRDRQQQHVIEWFRSLSTSLTTRSVSHPTAAVVCGLKGCGKTTLVAVSHRLFSNASLGNSMPVEAVFLCDEVMEPISTSDDFWSLLALSIVCALVDSGLAAATVSDASAATASLAEVAKEACSKRAVAVVVDISPPRLSALMSAQPVSGFRLPQLPGFMIIFTTAAQLQPQTPGYRDPESAKLQSLCERSKVPFLELPMLDARATLALVNSEISRYYQVAGHAQPADADSLSSSCHQFIQSVPVMGGHPLWVKAVCRCACVQPDEWHVRLSEHATRISALLATSALQTQSNTRSAQAAMVPHPPPSSFKPNLASSLAATAARWKRDGFDLFEKSSSSGGGSTRTASGSKFQPQAAAQDADASGSMPTAADMPESAADGSDSCVTILQDLFDIFIGLAASSLNLDLISDYIGEQTASGTAANRASAKPSGFISKMLHLARSCKCPVPLHGLCTACSAASGAVACVSWLMHEVVLLNAAGCVFVLRHALLPKLPPSFNNLTACLSLSVELGHSVAAWSSSVESALVADADFFRTQPSKASQLPEEQAPSPTKNAGNASEPIERSWFKLCSSTIDSKQDNESVLNSVGHSTFAMHSLLHCLAFARLGGLLQQWLMTPACAMLLGSSEMSRFATKRLWTQSHELGALSPAAVLMSETKRTRAAPASLPGLLSLLASANIYRLLQMYVLL